MRSTRGDTAAPAGWRGDCTLPLAGRGLRAPLRIAGIQYSTASADATRTRDLSGRPIAAL